MTLAAALVASAVAAQPAPSTQAAQPSRPLAPAATASAAAAAAPKQGAQAAPAAAPKAVELVEGMTLAEYAEALNRKVRNEAIGAAQPAPQPIPEVVRHRPEPVDPLAGWRYIGNAHAASGGYIFAEVLAPNGARVELYKGDTLIPGYTLAGIAPTEISIACPAPAAEAARAKPSRKAAKAVEAGCVHTIRRS